LTEDGTQEVVIDRRTLISGERRLVLREYVGGVIEFVERTTMALAHADEPYVGPAGDGGDWTRVGQSAEAQHARVISDVDAIEHERMEVDIQAKRGVATLHEGDPANLRIVDRAQTQLVLARCRSERRSAPMKAASTSAQSRRSEPIA
jgi:hypothetical protein